VPTKTQANKRRKRLVVSVCLRLLYFSVICVFFCSFSTLMVGSFDLQNCLPVPGNLYCVIGYVKRCSVSLSVASIVVYHSSLSVSHCAIALPLAKQRDVSASVSHTRLITLDFATVYYTYLEYKCRLKWLVQDITSARLIRISVWGLCVIAACIIRL